MKSFKIGDIVKIANGPDKGKYAVVYDEYIDFDDHSKHGVSIITKDGNDLGGYSYMEQQSFLDLYTKTDFIYSFENVIKLERDFENGLFNYPFSFIK